MIKLENVNKYFNRKKKNEIHVINNTSLELPQNGLVALLGPSGCGKTTLLNVIGGLDKVKSGNIYINGKKITKKRSYYVDKVRNLNIGYIFQNYYLIDDKTVFENVAIALKMIGIKDKKEIKRRVNYVLEVLGIYRYRNRLASMISGGERQRVGIARAIVKDPSIIIADEPTGNLDSANTIEIMNIIKSISKNRLVLLVTHENDIAKFYADRILEIEDGKILNDYENKHDNDLDYRIENKIYLKDFKYNDVLEKHNNNIHIFSDKKENLNMTIVVKNNNIYIKGDGVGKIDVIDSESNIELINDHYKKIDKSIYEKYEFNSSDVISNKNKLKYCSIFNVYALISNGFKTILSYSIIKKILLLGFLASGAFISYCVFNVAGLTNVEDEYFISKNRNYYNANITQMNVSKLEVLENINSIDYILPGEANIYLKVHYPFIHQLKDAATILSGSLTSAQYLEEDYLLMGRKPENEYEIVVDKFALENMIKNSSVPGQVNMNDFEKYLNYDVYLKNMDKFTIVGIADNNDPSIYVFKHMMINMLANSYSNYDVWDYEMDQDMSENQILNYVYYSDLKLMGGRLPQNVNEVLVSNTLKYVMPLNRKIDYKIAGEKVTVVGYYNAENENVYLTNEETIKLSLFAKEKSITIMPSEENEMIDDLHKEKINAIDSYEYAHDKYIDDKKATVTAGIIASSVILVISFIEIYLMIRASFLSRIKEIGIYRAIGVKKSDIYKMFFGEIFAISTLACLSGCFLIAYILDSLSVISYMSENFLVNPFTIIASIIIIYLFNIIVGLLPVFRVVSKTPAQILARKDLD